MKRTTSAKDPSASFIGLRPSSTRATLAARGASRKRDTQPEIVLRRALFARGLRYRIARGGLPGKPDVVFVRARVAVFCDGDFWHGRDLPERVAKLECGHNAPYWVAKISGNVARDQRTDVALAADGWTVMRFWETEIKADADGIADQIQRLVEHRLRSA